MQNDTLQRSSGSSYLHSEAPSNQSSWTSYDSEILLPACLIWTILHLLFLNKILITLSPSQANISNIPVPICSFISIQTKTNTLYFVIIRQGRVNFLIMLLKLQIISYFHWLKKKIKNWAFRIRIGEIKKNVYKKSLKKNYMVFVEKTDAYTYIKTQP